MKRAVKILLATVAGLVLLLMLAAVILPLVIDPNDYRDDLERLAAERTGRELAIEGRIELSLFPWLGAEIGRTTLGNAPGFGPEPFARIASADLRVRLLPLLWGEVTLGKVVLHGAEVNLARDARGRTNWADLAGPGPAQADAEPPVAPETAPGTEGAGEPGGGDMLAALSVGGLAVRDARLSWRDAATGGEYRVTDLTLTSGAVRLGQPFPLEATFRVASNQPELSGRIDLRTTITATPAKARYRLADTRLETELAGPLLPDGELVASLDTDLAADLAAGNAAARELTLRAYGSRLRASAEVAGLDGTPRMDGRFNLTAERGKEVAALLGTLAPGLTWEAKALAGSYLKGRLRGAPAGTMRLEGLEGTLLGLHLTGGAEVRQPAAGPRLSASLEARLDDAHHLLSPVKASLPADLRAEALNGSRLALETELDAAADALTLASFDLSALSAELKATASARGLTTDPAVSGHAELADLSPRSALRRLGLAVPETADPDVLDSAALSSDFAADTRGASLSRLRLTLDDTRVTGSASAPAFAGPTVRFDLAVNGMDVDRYLPPPAEDEGESAAAATPGEAAGAGAAQLPMDLLRALDIRGELDVGRLRVSGLRLSDIRMAVDGRDGRIRIHPLSARLYEGRYAGDVRLDASGEVPRIALDERLAGVALGPLLNDAVGKAHLTGTADIQANLAFRAAAETRAMLRSLNGQARFALRDGTVAGVDLGRALAAAHQAAGKGGDSGTRFQELSGSADIDNGRLRSDDLRLQSDLATLAGKGHLDLAEARVDYRLTADIGPGAAGAIKELRGLQVPVRITGPAASPRVRVDLAEALKARAQEKLRKERDKAEKELEEKLDRKKEDLQKQLEDKARDLLPF
jgi:AsmA protein